MIYSSLRAGLVCAVLSTPAFAADVTVDTAVGPATAPSQPEKTIVYDMGALDTLDALGVEGLSGTSNTYIEALKGYESDFGTLFEPDLEALNAASPDLVIVGARSSSQLDTLAKMAPVIDMTIWGDGQLDQTRARLAAYGEIYGKEAEAAELIAKLDEELAATRAAVDGKGSALFLLTNGGKVSVYGAGGRFGWFFKELGLTEVIKGLEDTPHGESVSFEFIRETNPDWILVLDRGAAVGAEGESARATLDNPLFADTDAAQNGRVIYLNAAETYIAGGGYQATMNTLELLQEAFGAAK